MKDNTSVILRHPVPYIFAGLFLLTTAVFWEVQYYPLIQLDDTTYIVQDPRVGSGVTFSSIVEAFTTPYFSNWHPLTTISFMLDTTLYGAGPGGHHTTSFILHIANTLLLFGVLHKLTGAPWSSGFVAAIFALHPYHVEPVVWISSRKDVLSMFFIVLCIWAYARYAERKSRSRYLWVCILFLAALLSKPMAVTLPFVLLLLDYWPLKRLTDLETGTFRKLLIEKVPLFAMSVVSATITYLAAQSGVAIRTLEDYPLAARILNAPIAYVVYAAKAFWPVNLNPGGYTTPAQPPYWIAAAATLALVGVTVGVLALRKRSPYLLVGWFWFLGMLVPVIGLVSIGATLRTDRYTYIPLIGLSFLLAWGVPQLLQGLRYRQTLLVSFAVIAILGCTVRSWSQVAVWENGKRVAAERLRLDPKDFKGLRMMGAEFENEGNFEEAMRYYYEALQLYPSDYNVMLRLAGALSKFGALTKAEDAYLQLTRAEPEFGRGFLGLGLTQSRMGRLEDAEKNLLEALRLRPDFRQADAELKVVRERMQQRR